ncbi:MAG: BTAD domain-containing putative transcriptional regulator [Acidobacteriota bacterium]
MAPSARLQALEEENARLRSRLARFEDPTEPEPDFRIDLLGPARVYRSSSSPPDEEIAWRLRRARRLLAFLALAPERRATRDEIVQALWPESDSLRVRRSLHPTLHALRSALGEPRPGLHALLSLPGGYGLHPGLSWTIDALEFDRLALAGRVAQERGDEPAADALWTRALALYRGPFLAGDRDLWIEEQRESFRQRRVVILGALGALREGRGDAEGALDLYRLSLAEDGLQEELHMALLRVYAKQGRRDLVRRHFDRFSRMLAEELGVEPSLSTTLEYHRLMAQTVEG